MREIIFRGQDSRSKKWIYGYYNGRENSFARIIDTYNITRLVNPETVGQYTGLTDKNGTRIFEGDVLKILFGKEFFKAVVKFGYYNQTDQIRKTHLGFYFDFVDSESYRKDVGFWGKTFSKIEVIGNVHDNPKLLNK